MASDLKDTFIITLRENEAYVFAGIGDDLDPVKKIAQKVDKWARTSETGSVPATIAQYIVVDLSGPDAVRAFRIALLDWCNKQDRAVQVYPNAKSIDTMKKQFAGAVGLN